MGFEYRYAASLAVSLTLAEPLPSSWSIEPVVRLRSLLIEQETAVDDVVCETSLGGYVFIQAKSSLSVSMDAGSPFAKAFYDAVDLFLDFNAELQRNGNAPRDFDAARDRIVIGIGSGRPFIEGIAEANHRALSAEPWSKSARNARLNDFQKAARAAVRKRWKERRGAVPTEQEQRQLFAAVRGHLCECLPSGTAERMAIDQLQRIVLPPGQPQQAWSALVNLFEEAAHNGGGFDKSALISELGKRGGFQLLGERPDHRADRDRLRTISRTFSDQYADHTYLRIGSRTLALRPATQHDLRKRAAEGSLLLVGDPGIGKTGACVALYLICRGETENAIFLPAERLTGPNSKLPLHARLGLTNSLSDLFLEWGLTTPGYLIVDGLDSVRGYDELNSILSALEELRKNAPPLWRFIASMRRFDADRALRRETPLSRIFGGSNSGIARRLDDLEILSVPELSDDDLDEASKSLPALKTVLLDPNIRKLAGIPFNLKILVEILGNGVTTSELLNINTQLELLKLYWRRRIENNAKGSQLEDLLRAALTSMLERVEMSFTESHLSTQPERNSLLSDLCSLGVLEEQTGTSAFLPATYRLTHNVLFDFALARLVLSDLDALVKHLAGDPGLVTMITPSLRMLFADLWDSGSETREVFWQFVLRLAGDERVPAVADLAAVAITSHNAVNDSDIAPLLESLEDPHTRDVALKVVAWLNGSLQVGDIDPFVAGGEPWGSLALAAANAALTEEAAFQSLRLQGLMLKGFAKLSQTVRLQLAAAARKLLAHWEESEYVRQRAMAIEYVLKTITAQPAENSTSLSNLVHRSTFVEQAWVDGPAIARFLPEAHKVNPTLVCDAYELIFSVPDPPAERVSMTGSRIFGFVSNKRQDLEHARWQLGQNYVEFFKSSPVEATRALVSVVRSSRKLRESHSTSRPPLNVNVGTSTVSVIEDMSYIWLDSVVTVHDPIFEMLSAWFDEMTNLRKSARQSYNEALNVYTTGADGTAFWRKLILRAAQEPATLGRDIASMMANRSLLYALDTTKPAGSYIKKVFPHLEALEREAIERAILS